LATVALGAGITETY